jgi:chromosome segregation ATPase
MENRGNIIYRYTAVLAALLFLAASAAHTQEEQPAQQQQQSEEAAGPAAEQAPQQPEETTLSPQEEIAALKLQAANNKRLLANENRELLNKIEALKKDVDKLKEANLKLEEANKNLTGNPSKLKIKLAESEKSAQEWRSKADSLERQCAALTRWKEFLLRQSSALRAENKKAWIKKVYLCHKIERMESTIAVAKKKQRSMQRAKDFAGNEAKRLDARNKKLNMELLCVNKEYACARNEAARLKRELVPVNRLKAKLAISYQQLGNAYAQLKQYNLAIDAYNKSLKYNFKNPVVHCNIGLLYEHSHTRAQRAVYHLNKYLELNPDAPDRNEITFIIKRLSEVEDEDIVFYN